MANAVVNISGFEDVVRNINAIQRSQLKFAASRALNQLGFFLRKNEQEFIAQTFNSVAPFTANSPLYTKSTKENLQITFFLRDTAGKGTPPSVYLAPQVTGGAVYVTGFTRKLRYAGLIEQQQYAAHWRPSNGGKLTGGRLTQILFSLQAAGPGLRRQGPPTAKQAGKFFILNRGRNSATVLRTPNRYNRKEGNGYVGPGIYTREGRQLQQVIPIFPQPLVVPPKYDWTERRIQGLADKQFSVYLAESLKNL
jgi:hypothetical protein